MLALDFQTEDADAAAVGVDELQSQRVHAGSGRERGVGRGARLDGNMALAAGQHLLAGQRLPAACQFG